jgi:cellulose synthase/poly-beta-1,6-N-acetylglucosamine synthase-like glycosyltransferase
VDKFLKLQDMVYVILFLFSAYFVLVATLITGWWRMRKSTAPAAGSTQMSLISVIVPARNEEAMIGSLLQDLKNQQHPTFEVIVVDDHSTDETFTCVADQITGDPRFKLIRNRGEGKKSALTTGIKHAGGQIVVTTDADCRMEPCWLAGVDRYMQDPQVSMVSGAVRIRQDGSFFPDLQAIESASLIGSGAAALTLRSPVMCNGANLAFRRNVFLEVNGYEDNLHIPSGDDEFLMRKVAAKYPQGIRFMNVEGTVVTTRAADTLSAMVHQRLRWAGKWRHNDSKSAKLLAVGIWLVQCAVLVSYALVATGTARALMVSLLTAKAMLECIFLYSVCLYLNVRWNWLAFFVLQLFYPVYVTGIGLFANLASPVWKGRKIGREQLS